ncbi:hypothetical protein [Pseudocnuella soli]|uniref:hypothetical protein n=1 Tax=Pseudocnuella soli TaxID=2502779 RepID=UPI0014050A89|nr:hypothetical protein [Pseudocnuella soli]
MTYTPEIHILWQTFFGPAAHFPKPKMGNKKIGELLLGLHYKIFSQLLQCLHFAKNNAQNGKSETGCAWQLCTLSWQFFSPKKVFKIKE